MYVLSVCLLGDPVSISLDRQREWDEAVRLHFYNQEKELLLHGTHYSIINMLIIL